MELTYQSPMMPASYTAISEEEMTYIDGGAFSVNIDPVNVALFGINFVVNVARMVGQTAFSNAVDGMKSMHEHGLSIPQSIDHYWSHQTPAGKAASVAVGVLAGFYAYTKAMQIYNTVKSIYTDIKNAYELSKAQQAQNAAAQQDIGITDPILAAAA